MKAERRAQRKLAKENGEVVEDDDIIADDPVE